MANQVLTLPESFRYGEPFGEVSLREQIAAYLLQSRGVKTDANALLKERNTSVGSLRLECFVPPVFLTSLPASSAL